MTLALTGSGTGAFDRLPICVTPLARAGSDLARSGRRHPRRRRPGASELAFGWADPAATIARAGSPADIAEGHRELTALTQAGAEIRYVPVIGQPVTFGVRHPVVLLPESLQLSPIRFSGRCSHTSCGTCGGATGCGSLWRKPFVPCSGSTLRSGIWSPACSRRVKKSSTS